MTLALRCFIAGLLSGVLVGYLYKPSLAVVLIAFVLGMMLGLAQWWVISMLETKIDE